ncbi:hypothetical protein BV20DRAFT_909667, partial [Pilatotrama ljubarskyi]
EIFGYLLPLDLLHLYRTGKEFHAYLKDPVCTRIWKRSRENVQDLPECPPWLSETQYAALCFDAMCQRCSSTNIATRPLWEFNARYCESC